MNGLALSAGRQGFKEGLYLSELLEVLMADMTDAINALPANCYVAIRKVNNQVVGTRDIKDDEFILTFKALIEIQKMAGYTVVSPEGITL